MNVSELPLSTAIITTWVEVHISIALNRALRDYSRFYHTEPISGSKRSGVILSVSPTANSLQLRYPLTPREAAEEIVYRWAREAQWDPPEKPGARKGWEIHETMLEGKPAAIVLTAWIY